MLINNPDFITISWKNPIINPTPKWAIINQNLRSGNPQQQQQQQQSHS